MCHQNHKIAERGNKQQYNALECAQNKVTGKLK